MPRGLGRFELNRFNGRSCCTTNHAAMGVSPGPRGTDEMGGCVLLEVHVRAIE